MKSFLYYGPHDIRLEEIPTPELKAGEVLVKVEAALTGGTDTKTYLRGHPRIIKETPSAFGYEFSGTVAESTLAEFQVGDRVVAANTAPCHSCYFCKKHEYELCENLEFLNGSFAEYIKIPANIAKYNLYKFPDSLDYKNAAALQTLAASLHGFYKTEINPGNSVIIYGLGAIGQCLIKLCKRLVPDAMVIAIGRSQTKLALAKANGADHVMNSLKFEIRGSRQSNPMCRELVAIGLPYGADRVIEAVGKPEAWTEALSLVRPGGTVNFFGGCAKGTIIELDTYQVHYSQTKLLGTFHHSPKYIQEALYLLTSKQIDMSDLISHEMPLSDLEKALEMMLSGEAMKVLISNKCLSDGGTENENKTADTQPLTAQTLT